MQILGAGMAGCLAGIVNPHARIYEAQSNSAENHKAVLRFRSDAISKVTGIPFKKVKVHKGIWYNGGNHPLTPKMIALYSRKVIGHITSRSISNIDPVERYIAPPDFHGQLIDMLKDRIEFNVPVDMFILKTLKPPYISTIPMPVMCNMTGEKIDAKFNYATIRTSRYEVEDCDIYMTIYYIDNDFNSYRATLTGSNLIIEHQGELTKSEFDEIVESLGLFNCHFNQIHENHEQKYGKILDINDVNRKELIYRLSIHHNIFSLGRFAIWKNILLDDVLDDIYAIRRLINSSYYDRSKLL